jgi:glycosyltransferase involved in cell wall biosynthesis
MKLLALINKSGCDFWRTYLPCEEMRKQGLAEVKYLYLKEATSHEIAEALKWCEIVLLRGLGNPIGLQTLRNYKALGRKVVTDYDDLFFNASPFNPSYREFGTEEVEVRNPETGDVQFLWKDGRDGFSLKDNKVKFHAYKCILEEADLITTTTIYLKDALLEISGEREIAVLPNAVDFQRWKPLDIRDKYKDKFRFGWMVSGSHGEDWLSIKNTLVEFLDKHKDAKFVCMGDTYLNLTSVLPPNQVEWYPFSDLWEGHYEFMAAMLGLDVAIAPLANTEFNRCKSPLKFAEYTALGWPVIAQKMEPYSSHIIHGETGLIADTKEDWLSCLESLYLNPSLRSKLHFNALYACKQMFDVTKVARDWAIAFRNLVGQREIIKT